MRKLTLALVAICGVMTLHAQTKQAANAMRASDPSLLPMIVQSNPAVIPPGPTPQTISGYYQEGFEPVPFAPPGWRIDNVAGPSYTWARSTAQAHLSTASAFIRYDNVAGGGQDWLMMPRFLVGATTDSVVFWMRLAYAGYQPDSLCIKISTTDSLVSSYGNNTLLKLREGTNYPTNATTWYRYAVSLQNYVGQQVYIAFKHVNVDGDGLYIDDVSIGTRPAAEVSTTAIISPNTLEGSGTIVPSATVFNNGTATQSFNVTTTINPGGYTSTSAVTALAPNTSAPVTFAPWSATPGTYTVKTFTDLPGDANRTNDTITRVVSVVTSFVNYGWDVATSLPAGRWATGPVFVKECLSATDTGFIYLISGADATFANTTLNTRYNTVTGVYTNMAPIPQSRTQISPVAVNGKIYVIGGYSGSFSPVTTNSIYDIATDTWTTGAPLPQQTGDYAIGVYNDSLIYVVGGYTGSGDINLVQIYDTYNNTWTAGTPKTGTAVAGCRMGISGNQIVFVGGYSQTLAATQALAYLGVIDVNNPTTITWSSLPNYPSGPAGRHGAGVAFEDNGLVYFAGGDPNGQGTQVMSTTNAYNTVLGQWEVGPNIPVGVSNITNLAGVLANDSLYIVTMGGYTGSVIATQNSWLNIGPAAPLPTAGNDTAVCIGNTVMLSAMDAQSYMWAPAGDLDNAMIATPTSSATVTTTYTVTMDKGYGCPVVDQLVLTVNPLPTVVANATATTLCAGDAVTLTGSGAVNYMWSGSVVDNVAFNPTVTDTYTVQGTDANGCSNTDMITVTVNPLPTVVANSTAAAVCMGDSVTLTGSGAMNYMWSGSVVDGVTFMPTVTDTYTVQGTDANGCSNTDMITVTVNTLPTVAANATATTICDGDSVTLTGSGASTYTWAASMAVTDNVAFAPTATDSYTVTGTDANGCMDTDMITVNVNPLPTVTGTASPSAAVCAGTSVTLTGGGAVTYTWTGSVTDATPFVPSSSSTYTVTGTDANGCMNTAEVTLTVNALPNVTVSLPVSSVCVDDANLTLTGESPAGGTWSGTNVSGSVFNPTTVGNVTITYSYTDGNGCSATATDNISVDACTGVATIATTNGIAIFPNPNAGMFNIQLAAAPADAVQVEVTNALGQVVDAFTMTATTAEVNISALDNGIYFVRVINGNAVSVQRVVKQ